MTRIDFFEVRGADWRAALCSLVERAYGSGERIYLFADSEAGARSLDELLWTFRDDSFLPHSLWQGEAELQEPIAVGWHEGNPNRATCLAIACPEPPRDLSGFSRIIDLAPVDLPEPRQAARARYRAYQSGEHQLVFHKAG